MSLKALASLHRSLGECSFHLDTLAQFVKDVEVEIAEDLFEDIFLYGDPYSQKQAWCAIFNLNVMKDPSCTEKLRSFAREYAQPIIGHLAAYQELLRTFEVL